MEPAPFFGADSPRFVDPEEAARLDAAVAAAYRKGFAEGERAGRDAAESAGRRVERALRIAADDNLALRNTVVGDALELGLAVADLALGEERFLGVPELAERITAALDGLDDVSATVFLSPQDTAALASTFTPPPGVDVAGDAGLSPGEARIVGTWSTTEITKRSALAVAAEVLG